SIGSVKNEGPSHDELFAAMESLAEGATRDITDSPEKAFHITSIMFTVTDTCTVAFMSEGTTLSGPMNFGGDNEPRGMTHNFGLIPLLCPDGKKFQILIVGAGLVSGTVTGYDA
ncbi:unnamed protein product, partial [marine sediment metagenome]